MVISGAATRGGKVVLDVEDEWDVPDVDVAVIEELEMPLVAEEPLDDDVEVLELPKAASILDWA